MGEVNCEDNEVSEVDDAVSARKAKRQELWDKDPESFIHMSELVIGTRLLSSGKLQCVVGVANQMLLEVSVTRARYEARRVLAALEARAREEAKPKVVPVNEYMNFARGKR